VFPYGLEVFGVEGVCLFSCGIVHLPCVVLGLDDGLLVCTFREGFSFPLNVIYNSGVSSKRRVVGTDDSLHDLIQGLLSLGVNPRDDFMFEFPNLGVEDYCMGCIDVLICILQPCFIVVLSNCEMVDFKASQTLIPFRGVEGDGVVEELIEQCDDSG
jgi:hypothetical protein